MSVEREINSNIRTALVSNDDFVYAHLVKFERPFDPVNKAFRTNANRFAYYTDGATDIVFDDGSGNGNQTYRANRILGLGDYSETIKPRAASMKLTVAAEDLGTSITVPGTLSTSGVFTPTSTIISGEVLDFVDQGFKEGDLIKFSYSSTTLKYIITSFTTNNTVINLARTGTDSDDSAFPGSNLTQDFVIEQDSVEMNAATMERGITLNNTANANPAFLNREVFVHKVFIDPETGSIIGNTSILVFKGIIASVNLTEQLTGSKSNWTLTSHWGNFNEVNGRMTTDETHRALSADKQPQIESTVRPEYATDLGFMHAETSLSAIANYQTQETRYRMKSKKRGGLAGLFGGKKYYQEEYQVDIENEVDLSVGLQGKFLPVVYGVQRLAANPIFADTLNRDNRVVYTIGAICEGEIHGMFNMYVEDKPLICTDEADHEVRNAFNGTDRDNTQLQCYGRMSKGNTISGAITRGNQNVASGQTERDRAQRLAVDPLGDLQYIINQKVYDSIGEIVGLRSAGGGDAGGLEHGANYNIQHPYDIVQQFFHGRANQKASGMLIDIAENQSAVGSVTVINKGASYESTPSITISGGGGSGATATVRLGSDATGDAGQVRSVTVNNPGTGYTSNPSATISGGGGAGATVRVNLGGFKRQTDYWDSNLPYWGPNHRLLDTCYVASKITIDADQTTIPDMEYVVKGKILNCFNYDNTYRPDIILGSSDNNMNFSEGDLVYVETSQDGSSWSTDTTGNFSNGQFKIMDKFLFTTSRGTTHTRFRLDKTPNLGLVNARATKTHLRLKKGSNYWHMLTWDHEVIGETTFPDNWVAAGSNISVNGSGEITIANITAAQKGILGDSSPFIQFYAPEWYTDSPGDYSGLKYGVLQGTWSGGGETNTITFAGTDWTGASFPNTIKIRNATTFDMTGISKIENITNANELTSTFTDALNTSQFERGAILHNLTTGEKREIREFTPGDDKIVVETPFLTPPYSDHKFKIDGRGVDERASINPAIQTLDYIMNERYGKDLKEDDLDLSSFITAAKLCDTRSDIEIKLTGSPSGVSVGDIFQITHDGTSTGNHVASGTVTAIDTTNNTITLTDVINKFAKKYSEYISFGTGDIVYTSANRYFRATGPGTGDTTEPTSSTSNLTLISGNCPIHKVSGNGSVSTLNMLKTDDIPIEYSLYDSDWVKYWRYMGWEHHHQREVTRHQTNFILDTGKPVFQNINALLSHFNGQLSYENGKYVLTVETQETAPTASLNSSQENTNPYYIDKTDIIGKIDVVDNSQKTAKNTIKASLADPQLNYNSRSVTFFNSDFLKADRNVIKTGNFPFTGITSYYNARINTEKELFHTRFSKEISFTIGPRGILLRPGQVISITYAPFGWTNRIFRIENLNFKSNCEVSVKAREYDDSIYEISKQRALAVRDETSDQLSLKAPDAPTLTSVSTNKNGSILLNWTNADDFVEGSDSTEIWCSDDNNRENATLLAVVDNATSYMYNSATAETKYFWIRHRRFMFTD